MLNGTPIVKAFAETSARGKRTFDRTGEVQGIFTIVRRRGMSDSNYYDAQCGRCGGIIQVIVSNFNALRTRKRCKNCNRKEDHELNAAT